MFWRAYAYIGMVRVCPERGRGRGSQLRVWILDETRTSRNLAETKDCRVLEIEVDTEPIRDPPVLFPYIPLYSFIFPYIPLYSPSNHFFFDPFPFSFSRSRVARVIAKDPKN